MSPSWPSPLLPLLAVLALAGGVAHGLEPPDEEPPESLPPLGEQDEEEDDPSLYEGWATPQEPEPPPPPKITLLLTGGAYYSSAGLYIPLSGASAASTGERTEAEIYRALLGGALSRQFLVLEGSVNPLPCLGVAAREWRWAYRKAQLTSDFNLVAALTAGFDEPFALSAFLGNVVDFQVVGGGGQRGRGYLGLVVSGGGGHIKQNELIRDAWLETEAKLKGDRVSDEMTLSWSFRLGAKLHDNAEITDTAYVALRRSRVDYQGGHWLLANSGVEYRFDLSLRGRPVRQLLTVDKKFPLGTGRLVLVLGVGLLWESSAVYTGALAETHDPGLQFLIRPNVVF